MDWRAEQPAGEGEPYEVRAYLDDGRPGYYVADNLPIENARLIAAAPDLYAALGAVMSEFGPGTMSHKAFMAATIALAKARGETVEPFDEFDDHL